MPLLQCNCGFQKAPDRGQASPGDVMIDEARQIVRDLYDAQARAERGQPVDADASLRIDCGG